MMVTICSMSPRGCVARARRRAAERSTAATTAAGTAAAAADRRRRRRRRSRRHRRHHRSRHRRRRRRSRRRHRHRRLLERARETELGGVVEVGHLEEEVTDVVDDGEGLLAKGLVAGDHDHAVLDRELRAVEIVADLLEDPLQGRVRGHLAELQLDLGVRADADQVERLPVGIELDAGDLLHVLDDLVERVVLEVDRDGLVQLGHGSPVLLGLAEAGRRVAADGELRPVLGIGHQPLVERAGAADVRRGRDGRLEVLLSEVAAHSRHGVWEYSR